jgi:hypothetical protein
VKMPPHALEALERQMARFRSKFGHDPEADEPLFFDPDADMPTPMSIVRYDAGAVRGNAQGGHTAAVCVRLQEDRSARLR